MRQVAPGSLCGAVCTALIGAVVLATANAVSASPQSRTLIADGAKELRAKDFTAALDKFNAAERADPRDTDALYFEGVALNRLGNHPAALVRLRLAAARKSDQPGLDFEMGWALVGVDAFDEAARRLEAYERAHPGRGQTSEFLGRAYLGLHRYDEAQAKFAEAEARDPALSPTVRFYRAELDQIRGDASAARDELQRLVDEAPQSPLGQTLREQIARLAPAEKPWHVTISAGAGFDSNVVALGAAQPLPAGISHKSSPLLQTTLDAGYGLPLSQDDTAGIGYGLNAIVYPDVRSFDLLDQYVHADYRHAFRPDLYATFRASDELTLLGGAEFRNQVDLRPALAYRFNTWAAAELAFDESLAHYFFPSAPVQSRTGDGETVALIGYFAPAWLGGARARLGYFHSHYAARGADFRYGSDGIIAGITANLPCKITADATLAQSFDGYDKPNSLTGFAFARHDDVTHLAVQLARPIAGRVDGYLRYEYVRDASNIAFYNFDQHTISAGLVVRF